MARKDENNHRSQRSWGPRTAAVHAGEGIDPTTRASSPNLVMSSTFAPEELAGFSARNRQGYEGFVYARLSNPTVRQLEVKLAALEGAEDAQAYASGMAASHALLAGRFNVSFDDVKKAALPALRHRVLLNFEGEAENLTTDAVVEDLLEKTPTITEAIA